MKQRLLLVDGNALIFRAFHALPPLTTAEGELVNAVYGFTVLLLRALQELEPDYAAVTFDLAGPTFRHQSFDQYKAQRRETPPELIGQFDRVHQVVAALNIPIFTLAGYEADDLIGTLAKQANDQSIETIILTGDMDMLQLVNPLTRVYTMKRSVSETTIYDQSTVEARYGVKATQFVDFKALKGDNSDNIPGVAGIGEKTAASLIAGFGSLDKLYAFIDGLDFASPTELKAALAEAPAKLTVRLAEILRDGRAMAYQSQELSRIVCDADLALDLTAARLRDYDRPTVVKLLQELEFRSLIDRLPKTHIAEPATADRVESTNQAIKSAFPDVDYQLIATLESAKPVIEQLAKAKRLAVDTETASLHGELIGVSLAAQVGQAYYFDCLHCPDLLKSLEPILTDPKISKVGHNLKYDYLALKRAGITLANVAFDTMLASQLLEPASRSHSLDEVTRRELGLTKISLTELLGEKKLGSLAEVEPKLVAEYAAEDADAALRLDQSLTAKLAADTEAESVYRQIELPLLTILAEMEWRGIKLDLKAMAALQQRLEGDLKKLTIEIRDLAGEEFNLNSPKQLSTILFDRLGLKPIDQKKTKTGFSTAASELEKLKGSHPIIDLILNYREMSKLQSTYVEVLPTLVDADDRLHTSYSQFGAATGRLSSNDPNLQNIPIKTALGREIRSAFIAETGFKLVSIDYSQIELRVVAALAKEPTMMAAFAADRDIHQEVADELGVDRRVGKTLNFAVLYGQGAYSTAWQLGITQAEAKAYIDNYFQKFAGLKQFLDGLVTQARQAGYSQTITGRRRPLPEILSSNFSLRAAAERAAINTPIQGSAADIIKLAMVKLEQAGLLADERARLLLQVHDELVFEVKADYLDKFIPLAVKAMEQATKLAVPLKAEAKAGQNWGQMQPVVD